ncbi:MAG: flavodoxin family protein [Caldilineales bacterium]
MRATVIYDSQYGNTTRIAEAIGRGLVDGAQDSAEVQVVHVA